MKKVVTFASLLTTLTLASAQPTIHGQLSGTLGPGEFIVDGNCEVLPGEQLTILPGTTLLHSGYYTWTVRGELQATGLGDDHILFTRQLPIEEHKWGGIEFFYNASEQSILEWCMIEHVDNVGNPNLSGGGIIARVPLTIRSCTIVNCEANQGGGIYANGAHGLLIEKCTIANCTASSYYGGGIFCITSMNPEIRDCVIENNSSGASGGGLYFSWSGVLLERNLIHSNTSPESGGAIFCVSCSPTLVNNTVVFNTVTGPGGSGGGLCTHVDSGFLGYNNIIYYNHAENDPECHLNYTELTYNCVSTYLPGEGNITDEPMFVDTTNYDFHLQSGSPCIDAGDPASPPDPDGTRADMGAYYFHQGTPDVLIDLTYLSGSPIPASGGTLYFNILLENQSTAVLDFDGWLEISYEGGAPVTVLRHSIYDIRNKKGRCFLKSFQENHRDWEKSDLFIRNDVDK